MTLKLEAIKNAGDLTMERIVIRVVEDGDAGRYLVFQSINKDGFPASGPGQAYWLPDREVKSGDLVVIYSKVGTKNTKVNAAGRTTNFFYWCSTVPIWMGDKIAILMKTSEFESLNSYSPDSDDIEPVADS